MDLFYQLALLYWQAQRSHLLTWDWQKLHLFHWSGRITPTLHWILIVDTETTYLLLWQTDREAWNGAEVQRPLLHLQVPRPCPIHQDSQAMRQAPLTWTKSKEATPLFLGSHRILLEGWHHGKPDLIMSTRSPWKHNCFASVLLDSYAADFIVKTLLASF